MYDGPHFQISKSISTSESGVKVDILHYHQKVTHSICMSRVGVEDTRLEAKAKDTKKSEAKDRNARGQGQGPRTRYPYTSQKNISPKIICQKSIFLNVLFPELTFVRNDACQNKHLPEITSARMNTCLKLHLPE